MPAKHGACENNAVPHYTSSALTGTRSSTKRAAYQKQQPLHVSACTQSKNKTTKPAGVPTMPQESARRHPWWQLSNRIHYFLLAISLLAAFLLGAKIGNLPLQSAFDLQNQSFGTSHTRQFAPAKVTSEANGIFPVGCKWREVVNQGSEPKFWDIRDYEYWDTYTRQWSPKKPAACFMKGVVNPNPSNWSWRQHSPRSAVSCKEYYCMYENLWFNNGRFYLLVDGPEAVGGWKMSRNQELHPLHVDNATSWAESVSTHIISGDTLIFDFVYFLHPTAIGHWSEMLFPLFSILRLEPTFARPPDQLVLLHLKKIHLMEWVRSVLAVTLGVAANQDLPPIMLHEEVDSVWKQILAPLEGIDKTEWVCFERALVVRDIHNGGTRTFLNTDDARLFRQMIYAQYGLQPPGYRGFVPQVITFQRKRANRRVINEEQMVNMLREFGEVRVVEFNSSTTFKEQLETMADTGVLISVHTSNLANSQFLPPGSAVVELIQRNWIWHNLDQSFKIQTEMMGDIHHYAWRARHRNQTVYINQKDAQRFGDWASLKCNTEECVEAHTNVDVVVNLDELRSLLADRLPLVYAGYSVQDALLPWPEQT